MGLSLHLKTMVYFAGPALLMAVIGFLAAACGAGDPQNVEVDVSLRDKQLVPETIRVNQDDTVTLKIESDAPGALHLHGYDHEAEVTPGTVADLVFVANATGRYRIAFHPASGGGHGHAGSASSHQHGSHDVLESENPISISVTAEQDGAGGVNVRIDTDGWRWAPEEVNMANAPGAGHAHVYVDGVKINRVYGPYHHLTGLEPGTREIQVTLNTNSHNELTYNGQKLEASTMIAIKESSGVGEPDQSPVDTGDAMSVEVMANPDPLGGYNLQAIPTGFEFTPQNAGGDHVSGEGFGYVFIDGEFHARLYSPWLKLPGLEPGMHEITVSLVGNRGKTYHWQGDEVAGSITIHAPAEEEEAEAHHHGATEQDGGEAHAAEDEYDVGYLEVHPR